jgi:hypothetical protein
LGSKGGDGDDAIIITIIDALYNKISSCVPSPSSMVDGTLKTTNSEEEHILASNTLNKKKHAYTRKRGM